MSYPAPRYHGEGGGVSAVLRPAAAASADSGIHGFKNTSGEPAAKLLLFTPGVPREAYFETLAEVAKGRTLTDDERTELFLRHDNHWV
jgi:hypothetical protein